MDDRRTPGPVRLLLAVLALASVALVLAGTRDGPGTTPDGVSYLGAATNLADGRGLTGPFVTAIDPFTPAQAAAFDGEVPFIQWPPLYPLALGVPAVAGAEPTEAARWVSALGLAATVALTGWAAARLSRPGGAAGGWGIPLASAAAAAGLVLVQPYLALLSVLVASELLYLPLALAALWCATRRLAGGSTRWLVAAMALGGAATLTRFIGLSVVAAVVAAELLWGPGAPGRRAVRALGAGALAALPALVWSWSVGQAAGVAVRTLAWHPPDRAQWELAVASVVEWVVPPEAPTAQRVLLVLLALDAVVLAVLGWRGRRPGTAPLDDADRPAATSAGAAPPGPGDLAPSARLDEGSAWLRLVGLASTLYVLALLATHTLFDRVVPVGQRLLTPLVPALAVTLAAGVARVWTTPVAGGDVAAGEVAAGAAVRPARLRPALVVATAVVSLAGAWVVVDHASAWWDLTRPGRPWPGDPAATPTAERLRQVPAEGLLASNDPALTWQTSGRFTIPVPVRESAPTGRTNERFDEDLAELGQVLRQRDGVAVLYALSSLVNPHNATVEELERGAGLEVVATFDDAVVLAPAPGGGGGR